MTQRYRGLLAAFVLLLPLTACMGAYRQPEVRLDGVRIGSIGLRGGLMYAQLHVKNPNRFDLETRGLSYDLELADPSDADEWVSFARGVFEDTIRVAGGGEHTIEVPIQFRYQDLGGAIRSILDTGTFRYRITGDVRLKEPVGRTIPYRKTGIVSMGGLRE
jgi:LEA14-like dessication related protein